MRIRSLFTFAVLPLSLTACLIQMEPVIEYTRVIAPKMTIRIGETLRLAVERKIGPTNSANNIYGFIYSNKNEWEMPYINEMDGDIIPKAQPELYPVSSIVEIIEPLSSMNNVSPLAPAQYDGRYVQTEFAVRGTQVGTAVIRAGFISHPNEDDYFRLEVWPTQDGSIEITVIE